MSDNITQSALDAPPVCPRGHLLRVEMVVVYRWDGDRVVKENDRTEEFCEEWDCRYNIDGQLPPDYVTAALEFYGFMP